MNRKASPREPSGVVRQGAVVLVGLIGLGLWKVLAMWALARWLGPTVQGAFSLSLSGMTFGAIILAMGFDYANAFFAGRREKGLESIVWNTLWLTIAGVAVSCLWSWGLLQWLPQAAMPLRDAYAGGLALLALCTSLQVLWFGLQSAAVGAQEFRFITIVNIASGAVWGVGALLAVRVSYLAVLCAWALSLVVASACYMWRLGGERFRPIAPDLELLRKQLHYGLRTVPGGIARSLNMRAALYLTSFFLSPTEVGVYGLVLALAETLLYLPNALSQVILGTTAARIAADTDLRAVYLSVGAVGSFGALALWVAGRPLLGLVFGPAYAVGATALVVLVLAVTAHSLGLLHLHHLYGRGDPLAATTAQLVSLVLTVGVGVLLIPRWGILGAAMTTLVTYLGFAGYLFTFTRRPAGVRAYD